MTVLVSCQLHACLERFGAIRAFVGAHIAMRQKMVIKNAVCFESLAAVRALVRAGARVSAHVKRETVAHAECFAANFAHVWFFPGVDALVFDFFVRTSKTPTTILTFVAAFLA